MIASTANYFLRLHNAYIVSYKLFLPESRVDCRKRFFAVRVVRVWNSLPDDVVSADSLPLFVVRLRSVDLGGFIVGGS